VCFAHELKGVGRGRTSNSGSYWHRANVEKSQNNGTLTKLENDTLKSMEKKALEGILSAYEAIGIVVAEQATATCNMLATALGAPGLAFI